MEEEKNVKKMTVEDFFNMEAHMYYMQMKRASFYNGNTAGRLYQLAIDSINNRIDSEPEKTQYYSQMYEIADAFNKLATDPSVKDEMLRKRMQLPSFVSKYKETILGDKKRKYDMSDMFNCDFIMKVDKKNTGESGRKLVYIEKVRTPHTYTNKHGQKIVIQEMGKLCMQEWNGVKGDISKYKIRKQIANDEYEDTEVYSNISIFDMQNEKYKDAVLNELLGNRNIMLSNANGYIGEITETPNNMRKCCLHESNIGGRYFYNMGEFSLMYNPTDLSAVMLHEQHIKENQKSVPEVKKSDNDEQSR